MSDFRYPSQETLYLMYKVEYRYEAVYISEFFKMCGFFVVEQDYEESRMDHERLLERHEEYGHVVALGFKSTRFGGFLNISASEIVSIAADPDFSSNHALNKYPVLAENLLVIAQRVFKSDSATLNNIVDCYVQGEYCRYSYIKRYFVNEISDETRIELRNKLEWVYDTLDAISAETSQELFPYVSYAKLLVARRVNDICQVMKVNPWFYPDRLINSCKELISCVPISSAVLALLASYSQSDASYRASVIPYYERALQDNEEHPAFAHVYYRMGLYYEKRLEDKESAYAAYGKAFSITPDYFRVLFKMAIKFYNERKFRAALAAFRSLIESFKSKRDNKVLLPIEYEYLCKCNLLMGLIHGFYWDDKAEGEEYNKDAVVLIENEMRDSDFFRDVLEDEIYCEYLKERIALREHVLVEKYI